MAVELCALVILERGLKGGGLFGAGRTLVARGAGQFGSTVPHLNLIYTSCVYVHDLLYRTVRSP